MGTDSKKTEKKLPKDAEIQETPPMTADGREIPEPFRKKCPKCGLIYWGGHVCPDKHPPRDSAENPLIIMKERRQPWEIQDGETVTEYMKFAIYRDLPNVERSLIKAADMARIRRLRARSDPHFAAALAGNLQTLPLDTEWVDYQKRLMLGPDGKWVRLPPPLCTAPEAWTNLARKWNWKQRAEAYDMYLDDEIRRRKLEAVDRMVEQDIGIAKNIKRKIEHLLTDEKTIMDARPGDIARLFEVAVKVERLSRGMSTNKAELSGEVKAQVGISTLLATLNIGVLTTDELKTFAGLLTKIWPTDAQGNPRDLLAAAEAVPALEGLEDPQPGETPPENQGDLAAEYNEDGSEGCGDEE